MTLMLLCRSLSLLLTAGVPLSILLETVADRLPRTQQEAVRAMAQSLPAQGTPERHLPPPEAQRGRFQTQDEPRQGLAEPLAAFGFLPTLVTQLISVGEQTGRLDVMLDKAAQIYQHELQCELMR